MIDKTIHLTEQELNVLKSALENAVKTVSDKTDICLKLLFKVTYALPIGHYDDNEVLLETVYYLRFIDEDEYNCCLSVLRNSSDNTSELENKIINKPNREPDPIVPPLS